MPPLLPFTGEARAARIARQFEREFVALQRSALSPDEEHMLLPLLEGHLADVQELLAVLATAPGAAWLEGLLHNVRLLLPAQIKDVRGLRAWLAQVKLFAWRLARSREALSKLGGGWERAIDAAQEMEMLIAGWRADYQQNVQAVTAYAGARQSAAAGRTAILLAVLLGLVPFSMANCWDAYNSAVAPADSCDESAEGGISFTAAHQKLLINQP